VKAIRQRVCFFAAATGLGAMAFILIFIKDVVTPKPHTELLLEVTILATVFLAGFSIREYKNFKTAGLIIENQILHIQPAIIDAGARGETDNVLPLGGIEVFISCFGILLDSRIIKFNLDGVHLKAVEIGREFIFLTYGTDRRTQKTRILHAAINSRELQSIVKRFRYETGVVPVIID
jgi:hypothetical protein